LLIGGDVVTASRNAILLTLTMAWFMFVTGQGAAGVQLATQPVEHFTVHDGLPDNSVRAVVQDRQGFLWFGTHNGLVRYDGYAMVPYAPTSARTGEPTSLAVVSLLEDRAGDLWIGTFATGLWRLRRASGEFEQWVAEGPDDRALGGLYVAALHQDAGGTVWAALGEGLLAAVDPLTGSVRRLRRDQGADLTGAAPDTALAAVASDRSGRLWVASEGRGLAYRDPGADRWRHFRHDPSDPGSLPADLVADVHEDAAGRIWVATRRGLARWNPSSERFTVHVPYPDQPESMANYLVRIEHDERGWLWIGAGVGLYRFDPDSGLFLHFTHDPERDDSLLRGPVLSVLCDSAGIIWGGSWHVGLNKIDPVLLGFEVVGADPDQPGGLDYQSVLAVLEDASGVLWVGTGDRSGGLSRGGLNSRAGGESAFRQHRFPADDPVQPSAVLALCEDPQGTLWIGTDRGLWQLGRDRRQIQRPVYHGMSGAPLHDGNVSALSLGPDQELWIGTYGRGLYVLERDTGRLRHYVHDAADSTSLPQMHPNHLYRDRRGRVWIGLDSRGIAFYDRQIDGFRSRFDPAGGPTSPTTLTEDDQGRLWVGAYEGLYQLDEEGWVARSITTHAGLPNDLITAILPDDAGRLWLSTGRGIVRLAPETGEFKIFDERDGLPTSEAYVAQWRGRSGTLHLGGRRGLVSFDPASIRDSDFVPPVVITELRIADVPVLPGSGSPLDQPVELAFSLKLPHDRNDLELSFASLHFARPERNRYRFRLRGADDDWRHSTGASRAFYTNLAPGSYTFEVLGSNADGVWNQTPASLAVRILPPWYETLWARILYVLVALGVVGLILRQVIQRERMRTALELERAEARQLQELDALRSRFFANISHEFRTPLTLLKGPLRRLEQAPDAGDGELFAMMSRNARRLGQLIDQLLDLSRLEAGKLPLRWRHDDVGSFLQSVASPFAGIAAERGISLSASISEEPARLWFDADILEKIVGNLLTNGLKYTPDEGTIELAVNVSADEVIRPVPRAPASTEPVVELATRLLHLQVTNSGSYIPAAERDRIFDRFEQLAGSDRERGSGIGLALVKELVDLHDGEIELSSDVVSGTRFRVTLPLLVSPPPGHEQAPAEEPHSPSEVEIGSGGSPATEGVEESAATDGTPPMTVLVVEDNDDLRSYLRRELGADYRIVEAADGKTGVDLARGEVPDLVVSDVMMPGLDGFELCQRLKEDLATSHVPVVLLTARAEIESRLEGLQHGADDYLAKPFDVRDLRARIANLIAIRRRLQARYSTQLQVADVAAMPVTSADERFLRRCREIVDEHLDDDSFSVEAFAREVALSRAQLHRKLKALTDLAPRDFLRTQRLQRAARLLGGRYGNVTEVAYAVGFKSLSHFARSFREQFGVPPSEYPADQDPHRGGH
jgi:signal transduction histidine kinase/ligand-binding sensor domain-containing protein/DNA-binding response OmpR family regulator